MYLTGEHLRASHFLTLLDDKIAAQKTRRLVLDSVSHLSWDGGVPAELRQLLYAMAVRFKARGVTSMLTLEAETMYAGDTVTERGYSPIADNILLLRYARDGGELASTICVVKTRGSAHDRGTHRFSISKGGVQIVEPVTSVKLTKATVKKPAPARRRA